MQLSVLVSADYVLQVEMVSFSHPSNTRLDGQCCDPDKGGCTGGERCDTFFILCLIPQSSTTTECPNTTPGFTEVSDYIHDVRADNDVILSNPFNLTGISTAWEANNTFQGAAQLYIQVLDLDSPTFMPLIFDVIVRYRFDLSVSVGLTITRSSVAGTTGTSIIVSATVLCAPFYFGSSCQFFNHCEFNDDPFNAVTCSDRGTCVNGFTNFTCNCNPPYIGTNCEGQNFCIGRNCTGRGTCTNGVDSYTCVCNVGYTGAECEVDIDECLLMETVCSDHGNCSHGIDTFTCSCDPGYTGADCEVDVDECLLMETVCSGHGNCSHGIDTFTCSCDSGYTGTICETDIDDCVNRNCSGNGVCVDDIGSFSCECVSGFTGETCNTAGIVIPIILLFCIIIPPAELGGGPGGVTLIGGVVGGLLVLMLILLLLLVVVVVCVRRRAQGKTIQDTQLQGKLFVHQTWK